MRSTIHFCVFASLLVACGDNSSQASAGGSGGGGGGAATGGEAGAAACEPLAIIDGEPALCDVSGPLERALASVTECSANVSEYWPAKVYFVDVTSGSCLHFRADNAGSRTGADLFGAIVDPSGKSLLFDDEATCSVMHAEGFGCPEGSVTLEASGKAAIVVGAWEGDGCPAPGDAHFELAVSIDGEDIDLAAADVCAGDLLEIIP